MKFTNEWFLQNIPSWDKIFTPFKGQEKLEAIEIGCFEGQATCWLLNNVLTHPESHITCVDPFHSTGELDHMNFLDVKNTFLENTKEFGDKVTLVQEESWFYLKRRMETADIIYVDGSHLTKDVFMDGALCHILLKAKGIIIFDDYLWHGLEIFPMTPKVAIDAFMNCFCTEYIVLHIGYQVILQKK